MFRRRAIAFAWLAALLALVLLSCQQILSIDGAVTVAPTQACGLRVAASSCASCIASQCCEQASACAGDPACAGIESCVLACGTDYACRADCILRVPAGATDTNARFDTCVIDNCESACGGSCGVPAGFTEPDAANECQDCIVAHVCSATQACGADYDCERITRCATRCATFDCANACRTISDAGNVLFQSLVTRLGSTCLNQCRIGAYWQCVGKVAFPFAKDRDIRAMLTVIDSTTGARMKDFSAKACRIGDPMCAPPVVTGTTDANGQVELALPSGPLPAYGFRGYFEVTGPGFVPFLYILSFPLSEPRAALDVIMISQASLAMLSSFVSGFTPDPARGTVVVGASDCFLNPAAHVAFAVDGIDAKTRLRYLALPYLSDTATETDRTGLGFILDAPALVPITVHATPVGLGRASSSVSAFARAGALSYVQALPTP